MRRSTAGTRAEQDVASKQRALDGQITFDLRTAFRRTGLLPRSKQERQDGSY